MDCESTNDRAAAWQSEDGVWLERVAEAQDPVAFRALFDRYYPRVFGFVLRRVEDQELAREVTSDVFLEVWTHAGEFRGASRVSSWIFGIARFKGLEAIRRRGRLKRSRVVATEDEVISNVPNPHLTGTQLEERQALRQVAESMQRLPAEQREALEWTILDGLDLEEVARRQQISQATVKTRVSRARRGLRRMLGTANEFANPAVSSGLSSALSSDGPPEASGGSTDRKKQRATRSARESANDEDGGAIR